MEKEFLSLKFKYVKFWNISEENTKALELLEMIRYGNYKSDLTIDLICILIDVVNCETINLDFYGVDVSKPEAKKYIRGLSKKY